MLDPNNIQPGYSPKPITTGAAEVAVESDSHVPESPSDEPEGTTAAAQMKAPSAPSTGSDGIVSFTS